MQRIFETIVVALQSAFSNVFQRVAGFLPNLISAVLILLIGWILAKTAELLLRRLLEALHLDQAVQGRGLDTMLRDLGIKHSPAWLLGRLIYWVLLILFLVPALNTLQLVYISQLVGQFVSYLPNLLAAVALFLIGLAIARLLAASVTASARNANLEYASAVGAFVQYFLSLIVIILALAQMGVQTTILTNIFIVLIISLGLALALALGLGSRAVIANILAGAFAREHFPEGREIEVQGIKGKIVQVGAVGTSIDSGGRQITVPNTVLMENVVE